MFIQYTYTQLVYYYSVTDLRKSTDNLRICRRIQSNSSL